MFVVDFFQKLRLCIAERDFNVTYKLSYGLCLQTVNFGPVCADYICEILSDPCSYTERLHGVDFCVEIVVAVIVQLWVQSFRQ